MSEILEQVYKCYESFCKGNDLEGWRVFSDLVENVQRSIANDESNVKELAFIIVEKFEEINRLRDEGNYTLLADVMYSVYKEINVTRELS